jgi:hypothetical protein
VRASRRIQACPGWRGDLAAYIVGALEPQERAAVRHHLGTCPDCEAEHEDLAPVLSWLALPIPLLNSRWRPLPEG